MSDIKSEVGFSSKKLRKRTLITAVFLATFITISLTNDFLLSSKSSSLFSEPSFLTNEKIIEEIFVGTNRVPLDAGGYYGNSIIYINVTVLPQSNSSVEITCGVQSVSNFSPNLSNVSLTIGTSFAENYTCGPGLYYDLGFDCQCTLPDSNATILWIYEVLYSAPPPNYFIGIELWFIGGTFLFTVIVGIVYSKRKKIMS